MFYTVKKELSFNDVARIKAAEKLETILWNLQDSEWLAEDLSSFDYLYWKKFNGVRSNIKQITKSLGWFVDVEKETTKDFFFPNSKINCLKKPKEEIFFRITPGNFSGPFGVSFLLYGNRTARFYFGPLFSKANEDYKKVKEKLIYEIARYFYSRKSQYAAVYTCLQRNKEEFTGNFGKEFIEDLMLLFSVPVVQKNFPNFDFSQQEIKASLFCQTLVKNDVNWECPYLSSRGIHTQFFWWIPSLDVEIHLENNLLKVSSRYTDKATTFPRGINTNKFPTIRVNDALKQILAFADFGKEIYEKVSDRIFVENL